MRYAGIKDEQVQIVSQQQFTNNDLEIVELPDEFDSVTNEDLIINYRYKNGIWNSKLAKKIAKDMKVAFVSNLYNFCGIATYSKFLYEHMVDKFLDYRIFIENLDEYTDESMILSKDKIIPCWKRGESLKNLLHEIEKYQPDIIHIQHEWGLFSNCSHWLSFLTQLSKYRVIVTMHSTYHHKDKTIAENAIPEIIVHLDSAKDILKLEKEISSKVHVIPHGCFEVTNKNKLWNFYKTEQTILQFGFLNSYKNFEDSITAVSILKEKYPKIFFTALCTEGPYDKVGYHLYYNKLLELIDKLDVKENVSLIRGYNSEKVLSSYLRTNKVAIFPYKVNPGHECHGASGAIRLSMSENIIVVGSDAPHFNQLPILKSSNLEDLVNILDQLFSNNELVENQLKIQEKYLIENSWANIAMKHIEIFERSM